MSLGHTRNLETLFHGLHGRLLTQGNDLCARAPLGPQGQIGHFHVGITGHLLGINLQPQNLGARGQVRRGNVQDPVDTARAHQGRVHDVGPVGGGHDGHVDKRLDPVEFVQKLGQDTICNGRTAVVASSTLDCQGIDLVLLSNRTL